MTRRVQDYKRRDDMMEEPEWFTSGPESQHETIELHGFRDDNCEANSEDVAEGFIYLMVSTLYL